MTTTRDYPKVLAALRYLYACNDMPFEGRDAVPAAWRERFRLAEEHVTLDPDVLELMCDGEEEEREVWVEAHGDYARALDEILTAAFNGELWR
jgi:hypothetical protein